MGSTALSTALAPENRGVGERGTTSAATDAFKTLLMSSAPGSMNLGAVRSRASDLRMSIDSIIRSLHLQAHRVNWHTTLDTFAMVNLQYQQLTKELRPLLKLYAVHPKAVNQENAPILPIMLATKVLPEMEAEQTALLDKHRQANVGVHLGIQYEQVTSQIEAFNRLLDSLLIFEPSKPSSGFLDPKAPARAKLRAAVAKALAVKNTPVKAAASTAGGVRGRMQPSPAEAFLAAALRGEGFAPAAP